MACSEHYAIGLSMLNIHPSECVRNHVVTPLVKTLGPELFAASVSIRRGAYDRIFRFIPSFQSRAAAAQYALAAGRTMVLQDQLS